MMTNAQMIRANSVATTVDKFLPLDDNFTLTTTDTTEIATEIRTLARLGRTPRWQRAIEAWAKLVEEETQPKGIEWAILQGSVYAGRAVV